MSLILLTKEELGQGQADYIASLLADDKTLYTEICVPGWRDPVIVRRDAKYGSGYTGKICWCYVAFPNRLFHCHTAEPTYAEAFAKALLEAKRIIRERMP